VRAIIRAIHDDGIFTNPQFIYQIEQFANLIVVINHRVMVFTLPTPCLPFTFGFTVGTEVHMGGVKPDKEGFIGIF
jgi:hypothetical protein